MQRGIFATPALLLLAIALAACAVQLVAPYNAELAQRASSMQAEAAAWDLRMRDAAGTIAADPRHPEVVGTLNRWRGEAEAMLTLAVSNDPETVGCGAAIKGASELILSRLPPELRPAPRAGTGAAPARGCEAALVAAIETDLDDIDKALKYCRVEWIDDAYFRALNLNPALAATPPRAPSPAAQEALRRACFSEFRVSANAPAGAAAARRGRAVAGLSMTLQAIVYIENRKRAALAAK